MGRSSSTAKLVCVVVAVLAVLSPLYIDRRPEAESDEAEEGGGGASALWLPGLLVVLILGINVTCFMDRRVVRFDPYWIHRVWGSSCGLMAMLLLLGFVLKWADAASPLDKYVKRKKLEPLETYVPAVLLTRDQFVDLEKSLEFEKPKYDESRALLRSGPASSLRVNIRAVAQYASNNGQGKAASDAVDECLRALEDSTRCYYVHHGMTHRHLSKP